MSDLIKRAMLVAIDAVKAEQSYFAGYDITAEQVYEGLQIWHMTLGQEFDDGYNPEYSRRIEAKLGDYIMHKGNSHRVSTTVVISSFADALFSL